MLNKDKIKSSKDTYANDKPEKTRRFQPRPKTERKATRRGRCTFLTFARTVQSAPTRTGSNYDISTTSRDGDTNNRA